MNASPRILIACVGNIFLGDDAFGVEVARRLCGRTLPPGVRVIDFGIRGIDLTFALLDEGYDAAILVDAVPRGEPPGTLYVIEPEWPAADGQPDQAPAQLLEGHSLDPARVLRMVAAMGGKPRRLLIVGCEPTPLEDEDDPPAELSAPVHAALDDAVQMVETLIRQLSDGLHTQESLS